MPDTRKEDAGKAKETSYLLFCIPVAGRSARPNYGAEHIFAGMAKAFCGRKASESDLELGLYPKSFILSGKKVCERCKTALINRDGGFHA